MIRKLILGFCFLLAMFPASAFSLEGLSVESPREQVVVFIDGKQVRTDRSTDRAGRINPDTGRMVSIPGSR